MSSVIHLPASTSLSITLQLDCRPATGYERYGACLRVLIFAFFIWPLTSTAEPSELIPIAQKAIEKLDATNLDNDWHFTMEIIEGDEVQIVHNDPLGGKYAKRQLITVNGNAPDNQRHTKFRESEQKRIDEIDPDASGYADLVDTASLQLIQSDSDTAAFSFLPKIQAMENARDKLRGNLLVNLDTRQIEKIEISNTEKLSPAFFVTVDTYRLILSFRPEQGEVLLNKLDSQAIGTAGFLKSFEQVVNIAFSDYKRASQ